MLDGEELRALGVAWEGAWGKKRGFQSYLARELPAHGSTVRRWLADKRTMLPGYEPRVREILGRRPPTPAE